LVAHARFIGPNRLVVLDAESGRLFEHDYGDQPIENLFVSPVDSIINSDQPVDTLNHGTCVGYSISRAKSVKMPDGTEIAYDTSSLSESSDKHQLEITGVTNKVVTLGDDANCIQFSTDWKRMLIVKDSTVVLYDFQKILATGTLTGNDLDTLHATQVSSAFFVGPDGNGILMTDYTNHVLLWKQDTATKAWASTEVYEGDNVIFYAEPDATGDRMILIESLGEGDVHGILYSISAREVWFDLGTDYKWLGAAFANNSNVIVSEHFTWARVFPLFPLSGFAALADKELSPECRPPSPNDYRKSACWPASYQ
jgi:hypothetical protein